MAKFEAFLEFKLSTIGLSFNWYAQNYTDEFLYTNYNQVIEGKNYKDWLGVVIPSENFDFFMYFAGPSIVGSVDAGTVEGTVTLINEFARDMDGDYFFWQFWEASISASSLLSASITPGIGDDLTLMAKALNGDDWINLSYQDDQFNGYGGKDSIYGNDGLDLIQGGMGGDYLWGGNGLDDFIFNDGETGKGPGSRDVILDFRKNIDDLDLRLVDANTKTTADDKFAFGGTRAGANDVWYAKSGSNIIVYGDTNGDARADFSIELRGVSSLAAADFLL